jgi:hypothetical protein
MTFSHTSDPLSAFIAYSAGLPTSIRSAWPAVPPRSALYLEQPHSANSHSHSHQPSRKPPCRAAAAGPTALICPPGSFNSGTGVGPYTTPRARTIQCHPRGPFSFAGMASGECCVFWSCWSWSGSGYGLQLAASAGGLHDGAVGHRTFGAAPAASGGKWLHGAAGHRAFGAAPAASGGKLAPPPPHWCLQKRTAPSSPHRPPYSRVINALFACSSPRGRGCFPFCYSLPSCLGPRRAGCLYIFLYSLFSLFSLFPNHSIQFRPPVFSQTPDPPSWMEAFR